MTETAKRYQAKSKSEMKEALKMALEVDEEAVFKIREHLGSILEVYGSMGVEPETILFEVEMFRTVIEEMIHKACLLNVKNGLDEGSFSPVDVTRAYQDSERLFKVIREVAADTHRASLIRGIPEKHQKPLDGPCVQAQRPSSLGSNEEQEYVPRKDRPNYIS